MNSDPEFVMPEQPPPEPARELEDQPAPPTETHPVKQAESTQSHSNGFRQTVTGLLIGAVIGAAATTTFHQADTSKEALPEPTSLGQPQPEPLGGIGDVEAPQIAEIVNVEANPNKESVTVQFEIFSAIGEETYRLLATQPLPDTVTENQATAVTLGAQKVEAREGETRTVSVPLDFHGTHPLLPFQVSLTQFTPDGVPQELDAAKILLTDTCEPPLWKSGNNVFCWNSQ